MTVGVGMELDELEDERIATPRAQPASHVAIENNSTGGAVPRRSEAPFLDGFCDGALLFARGRRVGLLLDNGSD